MRFTHTFVLGLAAAVSSIAQAADTIIVVAQPPSGVSTVYPSNKDPLTPTPLIKLPIGAIVPGGWLRHQLELEANGMGGRLEEVSPYLQFEGNGWVNPNGKSGWEEFPYWIKGYGDLGYVLNDPKIIANTKHWLDGVLSAQQPDGWFGPLGLQKALKGRPDMWPHMPVLNALQSYYDFSKDPRVIPFMTKYAQWQNKLPADYFSKDWQDTRFGDNIESLYWLYNHTGDAWLLDLATKMHNNSAKWSKGVANWHNVNFSQGFREPAEYWMQSKDQSLFDATEKDYQTAITTYGQFPGGGFAADENARKGYYDARQGFETCGIVEFMHSFEMLAKISGNPLWLDRCEYIAFNSLPAAMTPDLKALHYLTGANQVQLDEKNKAPGIQNTGTMFSYSPSEKQYRCCQHNHTMGWPYYAEELWHATSDGGLATSLYSSSAVTAKVAGGSDVKLSETTDYPFSDTIDMRVAVAAPVTFPLYLRVPQWCEKPTVSINGKDMPVEAHGLSYIVINRNWADGDAVSLKLPMALSVKRWELNKDAASVNYGPLSFSLEIGQKWVKYGGTDQWPEQDVYPTTAYNYGLVLDEKNPTASIEMSKATGRLDPQPFTPETVPYHLKMTAKKIPNWGLDKRDLLHTLEPSPIKSSEPTETISLIPMGAARLRITSFPVIGTGNNAHEWPAAVAASGFAGSAKVSASFEHDDIAALNDGQLPANSADESIPRFTFWNHKGTSEWVQYDFKQPKKVSSVQVYWFDDTDHGMCRVPASWTIEYKDGDAWKPVEGASETAVKTDTFNKVTFNSVQTPALRLNIKLQDGMSGGILEWKVE